MAPSCMWELSFFVCSCFIWARITRRDPLPILIKIPSAYVNEYVKTRNKNSRLPIIRTLGNSTRANSTQNRLPLEFTSDIYCDVTLDNSSLLLTRSRFRIPSDHFLYNFTLDNSNHVCQYMTEQNKQRTVVQNIQFILKRPCEKSCTLYISELLRTTFLWYIFHITLLSDLYSNLEMYPLFYFHSTSLFCNWIWLKCTLHE